MACESFKVILHGPRNAKLGLNALLSTRNRANILFLHRQSLNSKEIYKISHWARELIVSNNRTVSRDEEIRLLCAQSD